MYRKKYDLLSEIGCEISRSIILKFLIPRSIMHFTYKNDFFERTIELN